MCGTCGCTPEVEARDQQHGHGHGHIETVTLEQKILARNDDLAEQNRKWLSERDIIAVNLMSSPGSGKTTLLERTIRDLPELAVSVIEGDQETMFDTDRIRATGCSVVQINTGSGCHLDASMVSGALEEIAPDDGSVVFIENVGNLVCPALFDLGEAARVVIMSATEGVDKPVKYPHMFRTADLVLLNKIDLLPHLDFPVDQFTTYVRQVNPAAEIQYVSAMKGDGMSEWYSWLSRTVR